MARTSLLRHYEEYPAMETQDIFKFLFQSAFGCEHLVTDEDAALSYVLREYERVSPHAAPRTDRLAGDYSRVHLSWLHDGLTPETLTRMFCASATSEAHGTSRLESLISTTVELIESGSIPLSSAEFEEDLTAWKAMGFPAVHHSEIFRTTYTPAYRVVSNRFANFLPLFSRLDTMLTKGSVILALEGGSASGKSTLAESLREVYGCNVIHMDDFFLRPHQRTPERLSEVGGNLDRERFAAEVLPALAQGATVTYSPFDCATQSLSAPIILAPNRLTVVEGAYTLHPAFGDYCDLSVYLDIDPEQQRSRIMKRNSPTFAQRFFNEWIPLENRYFTETDIRARVHMTVPVWKS